jgi:hypothetical protein
MEKKKAKHGKKKKNVDVENPEDWKKKGGAKKQKRGKAVKRPKKANRLNLFNFAPLFFLSAL